ncbi:LLM class F420-dependent oxidoreductase [Isoptericola variabilis]|uniref:Putative F420-dependent oxidoreductase n=1 Tax=Isoptericola variabilis (strain 225) TaxID=743718 RepID=F6FQW9_ISOV2|nr:LLM class F420-dependent oxidoreductase [Isoptericola variabilis]AEG43854.1 putative F420-dependent oxidoreductase [Isoptericola variabilis 225]TWH34160.1 F420-dependent oxidoreductase-like protein [Isoptericola variabilis J7]
MRIGLQTGYWSRRPPKGIVPALVAAERLGLDSVWTAEAYGSDAFTPLAWWGSRTRRLRLGTGIAQMAARTPSATAMQAITLDHLSGGRFVLGLGASGPQVVEGWYGQPYRRPLARTREYVDVVRQVIARERPVTIDGEFFTLPLPAGAPGATGLGKALRPTVHPRRAEIPIVLAAQGPRNVALAAEIADGWMAGFYAPRMDPHFRELLAEGFAARAAERSPAAAFEVLATVPVVVRDDVEQAADVVRPYVALYAGGMGAKDANFHKASLDRLGYAEVLDRVQELYLAGRKEDAARAVPLELVEEVALVGPAEKVARDLERWEATAVTTLLLQGDPASVLTVLAAAQEPTLAGRARAAAGSLLGRVAPRTV